jgi:Rieske 2Fe-2S family protein
MVNRQDWKICESVQRGMTSRRFGTGFYAPMEDYSKDIGRYLDELM